MQRSYVPLRQFLITVIILLVLVIVAGSFAFYYYQKYSALTQGPSDNSQSDVSQLIKDVGALMQLPTSEMPTVATVADPSVLKNQPFFANAEKGDRVLIYTNAKLAILYRPSTHKIIDIGPINMGASAATPSPSPAASTSKTK